MNTPIVDFVRNYAESGITRFHMPGHKGKEFLGFEKYDITEIDGADVLSQAQGIINESEENASSLFSSAHTFFVTQGSTTAICAMLALVKKEEKERTVILAARNVHKAFVNACALLDIDVDWIIPDELTSVLECDVSVHILEKNLIGNKKKYAAVYVTSPDYLGNVQEIKGLSAVCRKYGVPLLVDNAHGAYLNFLDGSLHPMTLGADLCCDSAHKTLPVLTGGAYLHVSSNAPEKFKENAREKIALFSSTSPSYLVLQSLDMCNAYLAGEYREELENCVKKISELKVNLKEKGFFVKESEPLKLVIDAKLSGYRGAEIVSVMREYGIEPEFFDDDYVVLMLTPQNSLTDFERLNEVFSKIISRKPVEKPVLMVSPPERVMTVRQAMFAKSETVQTKMAEGRVCAELTVSCPPAVPISVSGERITKEIIRLLEYYGVTEIRVVKE